MALQRGLDPIESRAAAGESSHSEAVKIMAGAWLLRRIRQLINGITGRNRKWGKLLIQMPPPQLPCPSDNIIVEWQHWCSSSDSYRQQKCDLRLEGSATAASPLAMLPLIPNLFNRLNNDLFRLFSAQLISDLNFFNMQFADFGLISSRDSAATLRNYSF